MLTQEQVKELFDYREDGKLIRKVSTTGPAGSVGRAVGDYGSKILGNREKRYISTKVNGNHWAVHKLIFLYHHGYVPEQVDHINRNSLDNRIENLRPADASLNAINRKLFSNSTSGIRGVSWHKYQKKWFVYINIDKKRKHLGYYTDLELAELVAVEARAKYHSNSLNLQGV